MKTVQIITSRFGPVEAPADRIINMEKPVLGYEQHKQFALIKHQEFDPFVWLQAVDDPDLAFLMINPALFFPNYHIEVNRKEVEDISVADHTGIEIYAIVTAPGKPEAMTVNLQGPIVVNIETLQAKQLVLANSEYGVAHPMFDSSQAIATGEKAMADATL